MDPGAATAAGDGAEADLEAGADSVDLAEAVPGVAEQAEAGR